MLPVGRAPSRMASNHEPAKSRSMDQSTLYGRRQRETDPVLQHTALVRRVVAHLSVRLPRYMEREELIQVGMIGLMEAIRAFDAERGVDFAAFAVKRIRGAILDEVRKLANQPRSATAAYQRHSAAEEQLSATLGRAPSQRELAAHLGVSVETFQRERQHILSFQTVSSELIEGEVLDIADERNNEPDARLAEQQTMTRLTEAIASLSEREQLVLSLYYNDELNLKEIGAVLGVSESRISQILSSNIKRLRQHLHT